MESSVPVVLFIEEQKQHQQTLFLEGEESVDLVEECRLTIIEWLSEILKEGDNGSLASDLLRAAKSNELVFRRVCGGLSNILYWIGIKTDHLDGNPNLLNLKGSLHQFVRHGCTVRLFGDSKLCEIDRQREWELSDHIRSFGFGKQIYHRSGKSQVENWLPGRTLTTEEMRLPEYSAKIAARLGALHSLPIFTSKYDDHDMAVVKAIEQRYGFAIRSSAVWRQIWEMLIKLREFGINVADFEKTAVRIKEFNDESKSEWVICHNDLLAGNLIELEKEAIEDASIDFIDFEYGGISERGFDIANHFCERCGTECDWSQFPDEATQSVFCEIYLKNRSMTMAASPASTTTVDCASEIDVCLETATSSISSELDNLMDEVKSFTLTSHLFLGLWGLTQAHIRRQQQRKRTKVASFNYEEYGKKRLQALTMPQFNQALMLWEKSRTR